MRRRIIFTTAKTNQTQVMVRNLGLNVSSMCACVVVDLDFAARSLRRWCCPSSLLRPHGEVNIAVVEAVSLQALEFLVLPSKPKAHCPAQQSAIHGAGMKVLGVKICPCLSTRAGRRQRGAHVSILYIKLFASYSHAFARTTPMSRLLSAIFTAGGSQHHRDVFCSPECRRRSTKVRLTNHLQAHSVRHVFIELVSMRGIQCLCKVLCSKDCPTLQEHRERGSS